MKQTFKAVFEKKMALYAQKYNIIEKNSCIVVALSGGSDSVCLLNALCAVKEKYNISLIACHVNHMIRGEDADRDELFCKQLCERLKVEFVSGKFDVPQIAKEQKKSIELAARDVRYSFLKEICCKYGAKYLATAHNRNDNAETMIANFVRGSGLKGLCGIDAVRREKNIIVIRPILCMEKKEILSYLDECGENYVTDATNFETDCTRNKIRLQLIRYIEENLNPNFCNTITQSAESIENDNDFIEKEVLNCAEKCIFKEERKICIEKRQFSMLHTALRHRIIRKAIADLQGTAANIGADITMKIDSLKSGNLDIGGGLKAFVSEEKICIAFGENKKTDKYLYNLKIGEKLYIKETGKYLTAKVLTEIPKRKDKDSVYFDYGFMKGKEIVFRSRISGDVIHLESGSKKLKDLFIDKKIPAEYRDKIPVMECAGEILWVCAVRRSDKYKINKDTKQVLQIIYTGENME